MPAAGSAIQYKTLAQFVQLQLDFIAANAPVVLNKPLGPFVTAICYSTALVALVLQRLVQLALAAARLSTATGVDVDSFVADFGLSRLPAVAASGVVTFSRFAPAPNQILIPTGTIVQTSQSPPVQFQVVAPIQVKTLTIQGSTATVLKVASNYGMFIGDSVTVDALGTAVITSFPDPTTINVGAGLSGSAPAGALVTDVTVSPSFDPTTNSYIISTGGTSAIATVQALVTGLSGNAAISGITKLASVVSGIDSVTNGIAFTNGIDIESDVALQARFALYILGLSKATKTSIGSAISNIQQGLLYNITESAKLAKAVTISTGTTTTVLKLGSGTTNAGMVVGDPITVDDAGTGLTIPFISGPGTILSLPDNVTINLNGTLASTPSAGSVVTDPNGSGTPDGTFNVSVDDGSGALSSAIRSQVQAAVDLVRPVGVRAIVTSTSALFLGVAARVTYPSASVPDVIALRAAIRSAIFALINGLKPGDKLHAANIYRAIFNATSPGDAITTTIAAMPISTTTILQVLSTSGLKPGQLVAVSTLTTALGALPKIASIDSDTQLTLQTPVVSVPVAGNSVSSFSVTPDQVKDVHSLQLGVGAGNTSTLAGTTSTVLNVPSTAGVANGQYVVVTDESVTPSVFYQADPAGGVLPQVSSFVANTSITLTVAIGMINSAGTWTAAAPPTGAKVVTFVGASTDIQPSLLIATRLRGAAPNALLVQVEQE